eukprot:jgi/Tetstr1/442879/TSEL_030942.t1
MFSSCFCIGEPKIRSAEGVEVPIKSTTAATFEQRQTSDSALETGVEVFEAHIDAARFFVQDTATIVEKSAEDKMSAFKRGITEFGDAKARASAVLREKAKGVLPSHLSLDEQELVLSRVLLLADADISGNIVDGKSAQTLAAGLLKNAFLEKLVLNRCGMGIKEIKTLADALAKNKGLTYLSLELDMGNEGLLALGKALAVNGKVKSISLRDNGITSEGIRELSKVLPANVCLKALDVRGNKISDTGATWLALRIEKKECQLEELNLRGTNITASGAAAIADALKSNNSLQRLIMDGNDIGDEGGVAFGKALRKNHCLKDLSLKRCGVGNQTAREIGDMLTVNMSVSNINLKGNKINGEGGAALGRKMHVADVTFVVDDKAKQGWQAAENLMNDESIKQTTRLNFSGGLHCIGKKGVFSLVEILRNHVAVEELNLADNAIGDKGMVALAEALAVNMSLKRVNLRGNGIGPEGAEALSSALMKNQVIETVVLTDNPLTPAGARAIGAALLSRATLQRVDIDEHYNTDAQTVMETVEKMYRRMQDMEQLNFTGAFHLKVDGIQALTTMLAAQAKNGRKLTNLDLTGNGIGDSGLEALTKGLLKKATALRGLSLAGNGITAAMAQAAMLALAEHQSGLQKLDLSGNSFGMEESVSLVETLSKISSLSEVNLSGNSIGPSGAEAVKLLLQNSNGSHVRLECVNLAFNGIGDQGAHLMADALMTNPCVKELDLEGNGICDQGVAALAHALLENASLTKLNLAGNELGEEGLQALLGVLASNRTLAELNLRGTGIDAAAVIALAESLKTNTSLQSLDLSGNAIQSADAAAAVAEMLKWNSTLDSLNLQNTGLNEDSVQAVNCALQENTAMAYLTLGPAWQPAGNAALGARGRQQGFMYALGAITENSDMKMTLAHLQGLVSAWPELQMFFTISGYAQNAGAITQQERSQLIAGALHAGSKTIPADPSKKALFMTALKYALQRDMISEYQMHTLEAQATIKLVEEADFVKDIKQLLQKHDASIRHLSDGLNRVTSAVQAMQHVNTMATKNAKAVTIVRIGVSALTIALNCATPGVGTLVASAIPMAMSLVAGGLEVLTDLSDFEGLGDAVEDTIEQLTAVEVLEVPVEDALSEMEDAPMGFDRHTRVAIVNGAGLAAGAILDKMGAPARVQMENTVAALRMVEVSPVLAEDTTNMEREFKSFKISHLYGKLEERGLTTPTGLRSLQDPVRFDKRMDALKITNDKDKRQLQRLINRQCQ